jgi:hypothetical protein
MESVDIDIERNPPPQSQVFQRRISTVSFLSDQLLSSLLEAENTFLDGLTLIFKFSCLYSFSKSFSRYFTYFIVFTMWFTIIAMIINFFLDSSSHYLYHRLSNIIWMTHSASTYTIIAYDMIFLNGRLLVFIKSITCGQNNENFQNFSLLPNTYCQRLSTLGILTSSTVGICVILNVTCIIYLYIYLDGLYLVLRVTRSLWFDLLGVALWYFYSYGWTISLPIVCIPSYALHCRIQTFIDFIKINTRQEPPAPGSSTAQRSSKPLVSVEKLMEWYDELHAANRLFNMTVSLLLTVDILLCSVLSVFLLHVCPPSRSLS